MWKTEKVFVPLGELPEKHINNTLTNIEKHFIVEDVALSFQDRTPYLTYNIVDIVKQPEN